MSCICGYTSVKPATVRRHQQTCKAHALSLNGTFDEITSLKVTHLEEKVKLLQDELLTKDEQLTTKDEQLAAKDRQIEKLIEKLMTLNINHDHKVKRQKSEIVTERKMKMTEPQRRLIAARQDWKCANPDGKCRLKDGCLEEYDVDHIIPLRIGGPDHPSNMQALFPACHRRKTERDVRLKVPETFEKLLETFQACEPCT